jgi:thioredoxin 1
MDTLVNVILEYVEEVGPEIINNKIDETSDADFKRDTKEGITVVHFNAIWNFSNNSIGTKIKAIDTKHSDKVKVLYLDTDKCPKTKKKFKVKTIPTVIVMKDGKEIGRLLEVDLSKSEDKIWEKIEQIINK